MDIESIAATAQLDDCKLLSMEALERVGFWGLRIVVEEMLPKREPENLDRDYTPELAALLRSATPLGVRCDSRRFEIVWTECICYLAMNESYGRYPEPPEVFTGKLFRRFSWSHLLELTRRTTYASDEHPGPGPLQHFCVVCADDVMDVIACVEPQVRQLA